MSKQTAIQLLKETIDSEMKLGTKMVVNWDMYLELEQWQIEQAYDKGHSDAFHGRHGKHKEYYNETYKGGEQ